MWIDNLIGIFSPRRAYERQAYRVGLEALAETRSYEAAGRGRLLSDWRASHLSGDSELLYDLPVLRARSRQMVRDNAYVASALENLVANIVGTGIEARPVHDDPATSALAAKLWRDWALKPVDLEQRMNFYGAQKIATRSMIEGGETLITWHPANKMPNMRILLLEGDHLDSALTRPVLETGGRIVNGVEYDTAGARAAYHIYDHHPGDILGAMNLTPRRVPAADVDHLFKAVRISGHARGVPWFHAGLRKVRDIAEIEQAVKVKKRIEACLAVFRKSDPTQGLSPLGEQKAQETGPAFETLSPGMVIKGAPGESLDVVNPNSVGDGDVFLRSQLMAVAASFGLPYHVMTGDVSQANYSSLRASMVVFWALLDDWVFNTIVPQMCDPAFRRVMQREAIRTGNLKLLEVTAAWTPPKRSWVDPLKDIHAEIAEARAFGGLPEMYAARGRDWREALQENKTVNDMMDALGLAQDSDPRRLSGVGALQPAAGYLAPKDPSA
jgi:lambda family phage portal protein